MSLTDCILLASPWWIWCPPSIWYNPTSMIFRPPPCFVTFILRPWPFMHLLQPQCLLAVPIGRSWRLASCWRAVCPNRQAFPTSRLLCELYRVATLLLPQHNENPLNLVGRYNTHKCMPRNLTKNNNPHILVVYWLLMSVKFLSYKRNFLLGWFY